LQACQRQQPSNASPARPSAELIVKVHYVTLNYTGDRLIYDCEIIRAPAEYADAIKLTASLPRTNNPWIKEHAYRLRIPRHQLRFVPEYQLLISEGDIPSNMVDEVR
jgi:hypothetical protein